MTLQSVFSPQLCTQGMAVAAEALFQLVEHPSAADAVHQPCLRSALAVRQSCAPNDLSGHWHMVLEGTKASSVSNIVQIKRTIPLAGGHSVFFKMLLLR